MSCLTMRPCGPEPVRRDRSRPACSAMRLASGLANTRSPSAWPLLRGAAAAAGGGAAARGGGGAVLGATGAGAGLLAAAAGSAFCVSGAGAAAAAGLAGAGFALSRAAASSPSPRMTAIGWLTLTAWVPSGTRMRPSVPSSAASNSIVAFSAGISTSMGMGFSPPAGSAVAHRLGGGDDVVGLRQRQMLEIGGVGQRHVLAGDPRHRGIEIVEGLLHHQRGDLAADAG